MPHYEDLSLKSFYLLSSEQRALVNMLDSEQFNIFGTHTTRKPLSIQGARRLASRWYDYWFPHIKKMFYAIEPFDTREGFHFHSLIKTDFDINGLQNDWRTKYGRGQFDYIKGTSGATSYVSKYITKTNSDYDFIYKANSKGGRNY